MAKIQFDDIDADDGQMLVYGGFLNGDELIGFGAQGLADVLGRIAEDSHMEMRAIYRDVDASGLGDFSISFDVDEFGETIGVTRLKVVLEGRVFEFGGYYEFAEHNGMLGLRYSYRTRLLWIESADTEAS